MRLHPKYGLNPTMPICIFCGKDKGEVALLGAAYSGEAPPKMIMDDVPCEACLKLWKPGIAFMEHNGKRATGRHIVMTREGAEKLLEPGPIREQTLKIGKAFVDNKVFEMIKSLFENIDKENG